MAQPPSPHAMTGSLSSPGNPPRSSGRKTTWPGEPGAGSDLTVYGPGIAFGAPSSGSVVLTRSALGPGACANETHAVRTNAVVSADFMRRSLAPARAKVPYTTKARPAKSEFAGRACRLPTLMIRQGRALFKTVSDARMPVSSAAHGEIPSCEDSTASAGGAASPDSDARPRGFRRPRRP